MKFADLLKQSTANTSAAVITLGAAASGFRTLAQAIAAGELTAGDETTFMVRDGAGKYEFSLFAVTNDTTLTRVAVRRSSNSDAAETFGAGTVVANIPDGEWLSSLLSATDGIDIASLAALPSLVDSDSIPVLRGGALYRALGPVFKAFSTGTTAPADTTAPTAPISLASSSVTQTSFSMSFTAGTDNVGVQRHEWSLDGTSWTQIASGTTFNVTGRTAATTYTVRVRTVDTSGNVSTAATLSVTTAAASGDTTAPTMSGSIATSNITSSGYTFSYSAGTDNVGIDHYETSIDGGATWASNGTNLSRTITGRPASTTDNLRVRAHDAAGNISNVLAATVTTSAAPVAAPTLTKAGAIRAQGAATGLANVTTDTADGTLYRYVSANATETVDAVKAANLTQAVTAAGVQPISLTGISGTTLYLHVLHRSGGGVDSSVISAPLYQHVKYDGTTAIKTTVLPSTGDLVDTTHRRFQFGDFMVGSYWNVTPGAGNGNVRAGWGASPTTPPPIFTGSENLNAGKQNGMVVLSNSANGTAWGVGLPYLWAAEALRTGPYFFWLKVGDAPAVCINPRDTDGVTILPTYVEATG